MLTEEQAWGLVGLGFLAALALYIEQGTWDGVALPVFLIILFTVANPGGDRDDCRAPRPGSGSAARPGIPSATPWVTERGPMPGAALVHHRTPPVSSSDQSRAALGRGSAAGDPIGHRAEGAWHRVVLVARCGTGVANIRPSATVRPGPGGTPSSPARTPAASG